MNSEDAAAIVQSLEIAAEHSGDLTPAVYARLFAQQPQMRALFVLDTNDAVKGEMLARVFDDPIWQEATARYTLDDRAAPSPVAFPARTESPIDVVFAVGPEGGWSDAERKLLNDHGAEPLRLGSRVLRAETAVIAGLAVLQHALGDLR